MYKLIRFYNQNRKQIFRIILIIVFIIGIIQLLNFLVKTKTLDTIEQNNLTNNEINQELISDKSLVSGGSISSTKLKNDTDIINEFVKYCNDGNINSAYELLTEECKEEMFPSIQDFKNIYYSKIFNGERKIHTIENWSGNVYQVRYKGDILSTGNLENGETKQDYITIVKKDGENKININNYIGRTIQNKDTEYKKVKITVKYIDTYMDYEVYNLAIENNSKNTILLDTSDDTKSVYLLDSRDMKYYFYSNEIIKNRLVVPSEFTRTLQIKFSNSYSTSRTIEALVFSKFVLNYDEYKELDNTENYDFKLFRVNVK